MFEVDRRNPSKAAGKYGEPGQITGNLEVILAPTEIGLHSLSSAG
jgi:hypothetical protein